MSSTKSVYYPSFQVHSKLLHPLSTFQNTSLVSFHFQEIQFHLNPSKLLLLSPSFYLKLLEGSISFILSIDGIPLKLANRALINLFSLFTKISEITIKKETISAYLALGQLFDNQNLIYACYQPFPSSFCLSLHSLQNLPRSFIHFPSSLFTIY